MNLGLLLISGQRSKCSLLPRFTKEVPSLFSFAFRNDSCTFPARMTLLVMPDLMMKNFESTETEPIWKGGVFRKFPLDI
ncbi:MAG: hypothetical protein ACYCT9_08740 [Leptospirillum sp.]